jgi:hypothetical protein
MLAAGGVIWLLQHARNGRQGAWATFFVAWLGLTPLFSLLLPADMQLHYLVVMYPLLFALPAAGVQWASDQRSWLGACAMALLVLSAGWQARIWAGSLVAVAQGVEGYGTPVGYWWRTAEAARRFAEDQRSQEILLVMPGDQPWDEQAHILSALLPDTPHRVVDGHDTLLFPPHDALLVLAPELESARQLYGPCTEEVGDPVAASPFGGSYGFRAWNATPLRAASCLPPLEPASTQWASGARLLGYQVLGQPLAGATLRVMLHWETAGGLPGDGVHWFNHLVDTEGHKAAQLDHAAWPAGRWQPGDQVITHFDLVIDPQAAPGPYMLRVGQYTYPGLENIPVLDAAGNPAADAVELRLPAIQP